MKFFGISLIIAMIAQASNVQSKPSSTGALVHVEVQCKGLDITNLDPVSKAVVALVLEESYNQLNGTKDNENSLQVTGTDTWRCGRLCPDNDDAMIVMSESIGSMFYDGFWRCGRLCPDNDDALALLGQSSDEDKTNIAAWEKKFIMGLVNTRRVNFRAVEECDIVMRASV